MTRWSLDQEECIAEALQQIDVHKRTLARGKGPEQQRRILIVSLKDWCADLKGLRDDHARSWKYFQERWGNGHEHRKWKELNDSRMQAESAGRESKRIHLRSDGRMQDGSWTCSYFFSQVEPSIQDRHD